MSLTAVLLLVIWHFGRKPARGSLRLSRRQGDRNRAIRVQQEPLRFYEEVLLTIGDMFDFLVDGACELLGMAWQLLKMAKVVTRVPQVLRSLLQKEDLELEAIQEVVARASSTKMPKDGKENLRRRSEAQSNGSTVQKNKMSQETAKVPSESQVGSGPKAKPTPPEAVKVASETRMNSSGPKAKPTPPETFKVTSESRTNSSNGPKAKPTPPAAVQGNSTCLEAKAASQERKVPMANVGVHKSEGNEAPKQKQEPQEPSPMYKAALAVMRANAEAAEAKAKYASPSMEDLDGSTDGSIPPTVDVVDDETAQTESEDCDPRSRPNTAAAAQAILAAASDKRAAALQLLDAAAMPTIEVRTFLAEPDEISQAPVMRRTVSDSDVVFYGD